MKALILIFLSLVTLPFVGLGLLEIKNTIIVQKTTIHTEGLVIGNVRQTGAGGTIYNPMVEYSLSFCRTYALDHLEYHLFQILEKLNR